MLHYIKAKKKIQGKKIYRTYPDVRSVFWQFAIDTLKFSDRGRLYSYN